MNRRLLALVFLATVVCGGCGGNRRPPVQVATFPEPWSIPPAASSKPFTPDRTPDTDVEVKHDTCDPLRAQQAKVSSPTSAMYEALAECEEHLGKLVDALRDSQHGLEVAIQQRDAAAMKTSRDRVKSLLNRIPHVTFEVDPSKPGLRNLAVSFDGRAVPIDMLTKKFSVDPGRHHVLADALQNGKHVQQDTEIDVVESSLVTIPVSPQ